MKYEIMHAVIKCPHFIFDSYSVKSYTIPNYTQNSIKKNMIYQFY